MSETQWRTQVIKADRNWSRDSVRPVVYKFSNGREFKELIRPNTEYTWIDP